MNIFEAITAHHEVLRDLMKKAQQDPAEFDVLKKHLRVHHENEEDILLDVLKKHEKVRSEALESQEEHRLLDWMLINLEDFPKDNDRWKVKLGILQEILSDHLEEEEEDLFPQGREYFSREEMEEMGNRFNDIKNKQLQVL